ncbi:ABC transporter ATP-binding protein [Phyllobacterium leguminum]|uniref:Glutathione import ATP-binding protein GsiA n=1 Tax=Phyllobacterium leguminum TaxID=314237 RepID=A0A318T6E6_9HYPH|nr:ABC transporter ATP-binding protein [Phyllobacterium leguminum]PYE87911.1 peptide/nickel transport system ATP-binding protein [Phyllobacterium leguminum]
MQDKLLSVQNLRVSFLSDGRWTSVVHDISFSIEAGTTVAIVGESGSGKSVTSLALMRLLAPGSSRIEGDIRFSGKLLSTMNDAAIRRIRGNEIAMIFQEPMTSLNPSLTIGFQLGEVLMTHRGMGKAQAEAEAVRLMERVRIPSAATRIHDFPHRLSGGMRQRVMIAMALACRPKLLIADEPTTALDVTIQAQILDLIRELQREEGMSVLFITHDMGVVAEIADRTIVMLQGRIVESGMTAEIFNTPKHPYTRALLSAVPKLGSMQGEARPKKFIEIDRDTGLPVEAEESGETASAQIVAKPANPVLEVKNLRKYFDIRKGLFSRVVGRVHAVENVSFDIAQGETLALVGESGCGKSTTGRAIMRLSDPTSGEIRLDGEEILSLSPSRFRERRRDMQLIFQDPFASLNPSMKVGEAVAEPMIAHGLCSPRQARERVGELLRQVGLGPEISDRYPHEFSGGQRQRIAIARALSLRPKLIVADEAVSALDVSIKAQVVNLMLDLQRDLGLAFLFISHDMAVVERISHRVAVMYLGEIVEIGTRADIFSDPRHPYTKRLLSAVPVPDPSRRDQRPALKVSELKSPIRPADYQPKPRPMRQIRPDHLVQEWGDEWPN